ncbi:MAG: MBL fold metallo-hydrolase [Gammaproteobacteria bacterium]|nr:MBL fold metallo-hydrolase [Gammaproteobacteria bacterium]
MTERNSATIGVVPLGQAGFRFQLGDQAVYIDPYLSNSVEKLEGQRARRMVPIWRSPDTIIDADWVLVTHIHLDHCDPETLLPLSKASPQCRIVGPAVVCRFLAEKGISKSRLIKAGDDWIDLGAGVRVHAVPAAHPRIETDDDGCWNCVGFVLEYGGRRLYHSGDTSLVTPIFDSLDKLKPIDTAILPVNEHNYFREQQGIVGNMGIRDAFGLAETIGVKTLVPMHWDMFRPNAVFREEIELYTGLTKPSFEVKLNPSSL